MRKIIAALVFILFFTLQGWAQNVFIERSFWSTNPSIDEIKSKLANGHDILEMTPSGFDAVLWAILEENSLQTITFLLSHGQDINQATHHSNNYLMWATYKGDLSVMQFLLDKGSKTDIINSHGQSLLMHAAISGKENPALYNFCLANGGDILKDIDPLGRNAMLVAVSRIQIANFLDYFTAKGLSLTSVDKYGNGVFHHAIAGGDVDLLKSLVARGVDYKSNSETKENAFHFVGGGRKSNVSLSLLEYLRSLGLNPSAVDNKGQIALHNLASRATDLDVLNFFIEYGSDPDLANDDGDTPLLLAARSGSEDVINFWLEKSSNVNAVNKLGFSALSEAISGNNDLGVIKLLAKNGADFKVKDKKGNDLSFVLTKAFKGDLDDYRAKLDFLMAKGLKPSQNPLLHLAVEKGQKSLLETLLELGLDVNRQSIEGYTALHYAAMNSKNTEMLRLLITKGADTSKKTEFDESAYDLANENEALKQTDLSFLKSSRKL
jgi:ankyrin repeat protein